MQQQIFSNCRLVTRSEVINGALLVKNGIIDSVDSGPIQTRHQVYDANGDFLLPGFIEMHTDNLEKHLIPRPSVVWPSTKAALLAHDAQIASSGITTVLDALRVGKFLDDNRAELLNNSIDAIMDAREHQVLRAEHLIHMRCEVSDPCVMEMFEPHKYNDCIRLVSLMDHTPGQRQWLNISKYRGYHQARKWSDEKLESVISTLKQNQHIHAEENRAALKNICGRLQLPMASHDDTEESHIDEAVESGVTISEFPTTLAAARKARAADMQVIAGAPNLVRGESHSGNVSAEELGRERLLTGLSSDYVPMSLLGGALKLHHQLDYTLPEAVSLITVNIAAMLGLSDRGEILPGKKADLVHVKMINKLPVIRSVWRDGIRVI